MVDPGPEAMRDADCLIWGTGLNQYPRLLRHCGLANPAWHNFEFSISRGGFVWPRAL